MEDDDTETRRRRNWKERIRYFYERNTVVIYCFVGIGCALIVGSAIKKYIVLSATQQKFLHFPAELFKSSLMAVSICLLSSSIIAGICGLGKAVSRRVALQMLVFIITTAAFSVGEGILWAKLFQPGLAINITRETNQPLIIFTAPDAIMDFSRNLVPRNFVGAVVRKYVTIREVVQGNATSNSSLESDEDQMVIKGIYLPTPNLIGLLLGSFIIGYSLMNVGTHGKVLADAIVTMYEALQIMSHYLRLILPIGLFFVTMNFIQDTGSWEFYFSQRKFVYAVLIGQVCHTFVVFPFIFWLLTNCNFYSIMNRSYPSLLGAAVLASSSATMPITAKICEERLKIDKSLTRVVLPVTTTFNMNGTVIYEVIAVIFIAQLNDISLSVTNLLILGLIAASGTIATAAVPAAGAATPIFACTVLGLPMMDIPWLVTLESLLDHPNTVVNIFGDILCMSLLHKISKKELKDLEVETLETINLEALNPEYIVAIH